MIVHQMKIKITLFLLFVLSGFTGYSLSSDDSASSKPTLEERIKVKKREIKEYLVKDTHRVNLIILYFSYLEHYSRNNDIEPLLQEGLKTAREINYPLGIAKCLNLLSMKYYHNSIFDTSLMMSLESINILEKLDVKPDDILDAYTNLSTIYITTEEFEKALKINLKTIKTVENDEPALIHARYNYYVGKCYERLEQYKNAEQYFLKAKSIANQFNFQGGVAIANGSLAEIYNRLEQYGKAIPIIKETLKFSKKVGQLPTEAASHFALGTSYLGLKKYDLAIESFEKAKDIYGELGNKSIFREIYKGLYICYEKKGMYKEALASYKLGNEISDSLFNLEKNKTLDELKTKYETEKIKQEKESAQANKILADEKAKQSNRLSIGAVIFALIVLLLLLFIFNRLKLIRKQKSELDEAYLMLEESKKYELAASNLKALKSQMNPHFIFNSLNSIQDLILQKDTETSYDYIVLFAELVRNTLNYSNNEFIEFDKEIDFLTVYLELEKLRFGEEFTYSINHHGINGIRVPSLIIQPFLENSLKHGLLHRDGLKTLTIDFELEDKLICTIIDNGVGREESERIQKRRGGKHESFAMNAIQERLDLLSERFEGNFSFEVIDLYDYDISKGTKIIVRIPFEQEF